MKHPQYTITTPIGEECVHLNFFDKIEIEAETTIGEVTFINLKNKTTFWIKESQWIQIQREIKLNKLIK
jgi:hypothetical protein